MIIYISIIIIAKKQIRYIYIGIFDSPSNKDF